MTGGSRGIGKATAAALLAEGAEVAIAARDRGRLDEATPGVIAAQAAAARVQPAEIERRMAGRNLARTLIDASQVAAVITFLASPLSVSINGESIACGGGTPGVIRY